MTEYSLNKKQRCSINQRIQEKEPKNSRGRNIPKGQFDKQSKKDPINSSNQIEEDEKEHERDVDDENSINIPIQIINPSEKSKEKEQSIRSGSKKKVVF